LEVKQRERERERAQGLFLWSGGGVVMSLKRDNGATIKQGR